MHGHLRLTPRSSEHRSLRSRLTPLRGVAQLEHVMHRNVTMARKFAKAYAVLVAILALWAWYTDVSLLHSQREHLLPDILLAIASMPASLTVDLMFRQWPSLFTTPLVQLSWLTICAAVQASIIFFISGFSVNENDNA